MLGVGDAVQILGCSTKRRILETSSGCESFDALCGGALCNSSIVLIDEVISRYHGKFLSRAFLAEGELHKHVGIIAGPSSRNNEYLQQHIPQQKVSKKVEMQPGESPDDSMRIAWRYENIGKVESGLVSGTKREIQFDYGTPIDHPGVQILNLESYSELYEKLHEILTSPEFVKGGPRGQKKSLLRLVIQEFGGPLWSDPENEAKFLILLRKLLRKSYAVVYIMLQSMNSMNSILDTISSYCDVHVQIQQFNETEAKEMKHLGGANGFFRLIRLPRLSSVGMHVPPIVDLVFETSSSKGLQIRILHLPPAIGGTDNEAKKTPCVDF